ncbi:Bug family tripartite tricarboxylate transporter substrate binding protein [Paracraurococcus lichenis]|uniref:Tripartite tricarboxylate transporter substrate-binding protein n=1 Tax=Paracraurococcus lichenis TaxID=3064888 RepID=A0ABT9E049_9PROT|nr:tripartite tricarboxylate transporter substrate-binding protein [Paracraurococcus sp. LOR1-02]MDO9709539.1 tripartite tricarboxylate transporter substrate-binding protein [Paracraurococcus sp. LOR1-02]
MRRRTLLAAPALLSTPAQAQAWPERPVTMVVPFAPGGTPDIAARLVAPRMSQRLGQPVVVENRAGAGSTIGTRSVIQARPDGQTVLMGSISFMMAPLTLDPPPFDSAASLRVVSLLGTVPYVLIVRADAPPKDLAGFHRWVAENPGKLNYGSAGSGTPLHLGGAIYGLLTGTDLVHIAYRGSGPAIADLLAGQVQMVFADLPAAAPHIQSGAVRLLASAVQHRLPGYPQVPTMAESDKRLAEYDIYSWAMLVSPKATPDLPVRRLHEALAEAGRAPELQPRFADLGFDIVLNSPEEGDALLAREQAKWASLIKRAGVKADF